jgi:hypothetical protein
LTGRNHRQGYFAGFRFDVEHPDGHSIADRNDFIRAADVAVGHLTDVNQTAFPQADVYESPERYDIQDGTA